MPNLDEHEDDAKLAPKLAAALKDVHKATIFVPPSVDNTVLAKAREHLGQLPKRRPSWRPVLPWVALAASVVLVAWLVHTLNRPPGPVASFAQADINRDGRVDILDAFALARQIESGGTLEARWDITGDGRINRADVDAIANRAVNLGGTVAAAAKPPKDRQAEANGLEAACVVGDNHPAWQVRNLSMNLPKDSGRTEIQRQSLSVANLWALDLSASWPQCAIKKSAWLPITPPAPSPTGGEGDRRPDHGAAPRGSFAVEWPNRENGS